jgi:hypothetical protein
MGYSQRNVASPGIVKSNKPPTMVNGTWSNDQVIHQSNPGAAMLITAANQMIGNQISRREKVYVRVVITGKLYTHSAMLPKGVLIVARLIA